MEKYVPPYHIIEITFDGFDNNELRDPKVYFRFVKDSVKDSGKVLSSSRLISNYAHNVDTAYDDKCLDIRIKEVWLENNIATKLRCNITFGKDDEIVEYPDQILTVDKERSHNWEITGAGIAVCSSCQEKRGIAVVNIKAGIPSTVNISGIKEDKDSMVFMIPEVSFNDWGFNGKKSFPALKIDANVYLIPPTSDSSAICEDKGEGKFDVKVVYSN